MSISRGLLVISLGFTLMAVAVTPSTVALAAPAGADAKAHAEKGRRLYDLRRYDDAIVEFEKAYEAAGDAAQLYNIAQAHRLANRPAQAAQYYERYLARNPQAPNRADIEKRIAELRAVAAQQPVPAAPANPWPTPVGLPPAQPGHTPAPEPYGQYNGTHPSYGPAPTPGMPISKPDEPKHDGPFFRVNLGFAYMQSSASGTVSGQQMKFKFSGSAGVFSVAAGWALSEQLVIFGEGFAAAISDPKLKLEVSGFTGEGKLDGSYSNVGAGGGMVLFINPINVYASVSVNVSKNSGKDDVSGEEFSTKWGPGVTASAGKEWWVGNDLGIGAAAHVHYSRSKDKVDPLTFHTVWTGVAFTLTYN